MKVKIENILRNIKEKIDLSHTLFEAISNSFDAEANAIIIVFKAENNLDVESKLVSSFTVEDNGVGFTEKNIDSFSEYLTDHKIELGCKGIGRFTWLKVFENVRIISELDDKIVNINFDKNYSKEKSVIETYHKTEKKKTSIVFQNCINIEKLSIELDLEKIKQSILDHFILKFSIYKHNYEKFTITLREEGKPDSILISLEDISNTSKQKFTIVDNNKQKVVFTLIYFFMNDIKSSNKVSLCASNRVVEEILTEYKSMKLPYDTKGVFLVFSDYLNSRVNNSRTSFEMDKTSDYPSVVDPITYKKIIAETKSQIDKLIIDKFPEVQADNEVTMQELKNEYPYLIKYFVEDTSVIKRKAKMIKDAENKFKTEKAAIKESFSKMLESKNIDPREFSELVEKISDISNRELAQYFIYRQQIIDALEKLEFDKKGLENLLHILFMKKNTSASPDEEDYIYSNNVWLLDDKFMSFKNIFSDKRIDYIIEEITNQNLLEYNNPEKPDLTVYYSNKSIVVVEFKGLNAAPQNKLNAIVEINRNLAIVAEQFEDIHSQYGFIITSFDEKFLRYLRAQPLTKEMFTNSTDSMFYYYNEKIKNKNGDSVPTHVYIVSTNSVWKDANSRNKTFIDILKNT